MYQIATLNKISEKGLERFTDQYEIVQDAAAAQGILVRSQDMCSMEFSDKLLSIARAGAGVNNIPVSNCAEQGIVVFNTPGANANAVKELVLAGILLASRDIIGGANWADSLSEDIAQTVEKGKAKFAGCEIKGKTLGVVGIGAIGVMVANAAASLGMKVIGFDAFISVKSALELSNKIKLADSMDALVPQCDYITLHVPFMEETKGYISEKIFGLMKDGTVLLNFSRDSIVDEAALGTAIKAGKIHRYVTDFPNAKVAGMEKVIRIPHLGASTEESEENCAAMAVDQLMDFLENGNITNSVNFPNCSMGICDTAGRIAVLHKNIPSMIGKITNFLASMNINISDMTNRSKGEYQYTLLDVDSPVKDSELNSLRTIEGIIHARVVK